MVADAALMLWSRAKTILHRHQSPILSFTKCLARIDSVGKVSATVFSLFRRVRVYLSFVRFSKQNVMFLIKQIFAKFCTILGA